MDKTLRKAIDTFGKDMQLTVAVEEFAELTKEICKHKRGSDNLASINRRDGGLLYYARGDADYI